MDTQYMVSKVNTVDIMGTEITYKEWNQQQVVTFADIDAVHKRPSGTARWTFGRHKDRFELNTDYFVCTTHEAREYFHIKAPNGLYLITEQGYTMLVKPFDDDLSWKVQRTMSNSYFRYKDIVKNTLKDEFRTSEESNELEFTIPWPKQIMSRLAPCIDYIKETTDPDASIKNTLGKINKMVTAKYGADFNQYTEAYKKANPNDERLYILSIVDYFPKLRKAYDDTVNQFISNALNM